MSALIIEGRPKIIRFDPGEWHFEIKHDLITWRLYETQWLQHIGDVARVQKEFLGHHELRRLRNDEDLLDDNIIPLHEELRARLDKLQGRG